PCLGNRHAGGAALHLLLRPVSSGIADLSAVAVRPYMGETLNKPTTSDPLARPMTRRELLKKATGASLTLAAAQALSPFILSGCSTSKTGNGGSGAIKVGILHSLTGT